MMGRFLPHVLCSAMLCFATVSFTHASIVIEKTKPINTATPASLKPKSSVLLTCKLSETAVQISRAVVLQISQHSKNMSDYEFALTTGHGLRDISSNEEIETCYVTGPSGIPAKVLHVKFADQYQAGTPTDWAVLVFQTMQKEGLVRFLLPQSEGLNGFDEMAEVFMPVKFSAARSIPYNRQNCTLAPMRKASFTHPHHDGFMPHTCKSRSGQSGSPISVQSHGKPVVLGLHTGRVFSFGELGKKERPRFYGYMRVFDAEMVQELNGLLRNIQDEFTHEK